jgi:hypothetical protein
LKRVLVVLFVGPLALAALGTIRVGVIWISLLPPPPLRTSAKGTILQSGVTIVVPGQERIAHHRVVIRAASIYEAGHARPNPDDPFAGAYLLPGLNDLHAHWPPRAVPGQLELFAFLHLSYGVTAVSMGDDFDGSSVAAREGVDSSRLPGPRVLTCGKIVDGDPPLLRGSLVANSAEQSAAIANEIADASFDCIKGYDELTEESAIALLSARDTERLRR